jgi:hypothetical protein
VFAAVAAEAAYLLPEQYEAEVARRIRLIMDDPILYHRGASGALTGDSELRPRGLYPDDADP